MNRAASPGPQAGGKRPRQVAITGFGVATGSGIGRHAFWEGLHTSRSPVTPVSRFDASSFRTQIAVEIPELRPQDFMERDRARRLDRFGHLSVATTRMALEDAGLDPSRVDPDRVAVQMGSALGGIAHAEEQMGGFIDGGIRKVDPRLALTVFCGAASCNVAIEFGFRGANSTNAMSCASGTIAVGDGFRLIRDGQADLVVAGGVEAPLAPLTFGAFSLIRAMSTRNDAPEQACRPFDSERDGFVMGEGAGVLVLEEYTGALERGARIYALVSGYGTTNDAHHMTAPLPDGSQAARAMAQALESAGMGPGEVHYVNAHASSTPLNDATESQAIRSVLGERSHQVPVTGTKPFYGHALGASGAIEAGICALAIHEGWVPPTLNLQVPGPGCDLDYQPGSGRTLEIRHALSNSFGFGGINACLVLSANDSEGP